MTGIDWGIVAFTALMLLWGYQQGLIVGVLSLAGFAGGGFLGSRLGPLLLEEGSSSPYAPMMTLLAALLVGGMVAIFFEGIGQGVRTRLVRRRSHGVADGIGGSLLVGAVGMAIVWVFGAVALNTPGAPDLRRSVQRSAILKQLNELVPPRGPILNALNRIDPFPEIQGPDDTTVTARNAGQRLRAVAVHYDPSNDLAILRSDLLDAPALEMATSPEPGIPGAILGYPENGPFQVSPGRLGQTETVISQDSYGRGPIRRVMTSIRGRIRSGNSGGPAVDRRGRVLTTIFAAKTGSGVAGGFGVPNDVVRAALQRTSRQLSTGPCTR